MEKGKWFVRRAKDRVVYPNLMQQKDGSHAQDAMVREPLHAQNVMVAEKHRASLYQTINQLLRAGLVTSWEATRQEGSSERAVYKLANKGHETSLIWVREMLPAPAIGIFKTVDLPAIFAPSKEIAEGNSIYTP